MSWDNPFAAQSSNTDPLNVTVEEKARPDRDSHPGPLAHRASTDHWATEPHGRPVTISPCLMRFVPESARKHARTDETVPLLLAARARTHTEPRNEMSLGRKKAHGLTGTRTQDLSHTVRALWPLSYTVHLWHDLHTLIQKSQNLLGPWQPRWLQRLSVKAVTEPKLRKLPKFTDGQLLIVMNSNTRI